MLCALLLVRFVQEQRVAPAEVVLHLRVKAIKFGLLLSVHSWVPEARLEIPLPPSYCSA